MITSTKPSLNKIFFIISLVFLAIYLLINLVYKNRVPPNTNFANTNIANKTSSEAEAIIASKIDFYQSATITFNIDSELVKIDLINLGIKINKAKTINNFKSRSNNNIFSFKKNVFRPSYSINLTKISSILSEYEDPPINASIDFIDGKFSIKNEADGKLINRSKLISDIKERVGNLRQLPIEVDIIKTVPLIKKAQTEKALEKVKILSKQQISLVFERDNWDISENLLLELLSFYPQGQQNWTIAQLSLQKSPLIIKSLNYSSKAEEILDVSLNTQKLEEFINQIAYQINRPTVNASLEFKDGKVTNFIPAQDGQNLDTTLTINLILEKVSIKSTSADEKIVINLPVSIVNAKIESDEITNLGIKELLGRGISYYRGSIANRIYNIALGSGRLSGTLVKPGETFSFNKSVGEVSSKTGYKEAYIITKGRTELDDGGGICQVSTTTFRAALNAGLPIIKRTAHSYRVSYYEQGGFKPGLDATVWAPAVDFQFKNDTNYHILVQTIVDKVNSKLQIDIYGTSDGRTVDLSTPVISNVKPAPPDKYEEDPTLQRGITKQIDFAASGATSIFTRNVTRNSEAIISDSFKSYYRPWQAVYLVGVKD